MPTQDVSFYDTPVTEPFNPLQAIGQFANTKNALTQGQLLQMQARNRVAQGKNFQAATDPTTGVLNVNKYNLLNAQDPNARTYGNENAQNANSANPLVGYTGQNNGSFVPMQAPLPVVRAMNTPGQTASPGNTQTSVGPLQPQGYSATMPENQLTGGPSQSQPQQPQTPPVSQTQIDQLHAHNGAILDTLEPLVNDPNLDQSKIIGAVSDLVAHPEAQFKATDAASILSQLPHGKDGSPATAEQLRPLLLQQLQKQKMQQSVLDQRFPSSAQIAQHRAAAAPQTVTTAGPEEKLSQNSTQAVSENSPGTMTGAPVGYTSPLVESRNNYNKVGEAASGAATMNAAYSEAINEVNSGAPSGTAISDMYQKLAKTGIMPADITDKAVQTQKLGKWMAQGLLANGMPGSDARLAELQHANLNPDQLAQTIKDLAPFFKAVSEGAIAKQSYYNRVTNNGSDLSHEPQALQNWNQNFDPRFIEMDDLPDAKSKAEFLSNHPDLLDPRNKQKWHFLKNMGVVGK